MPRRFRTLLMRRFNILPTCEKHGMRPGGFGVLWTRSLVNELIYNEKGNEVILIKYLDHALAGDAVGA